MTAIVCCHRCGHACAHTPPHPLVDTPDGPACADRDFCDQLAVADAGEHVEPYGAELARLEQELDAARAQGYAEAVARLRDDERYRNWWSGDGAWQHAPTGRYWDATARGHLADYLETVGQPMPAEQRAEGAEADLRAKLARVEAERDDWKARLHKFWDEGDEEALKRISQVRRMVQAEATVERVRHEANCWSFLDDESVTVDELRDRILAALDGPTDTEGNDHG